MQRRVDVSSVEVKPLMQDMHKVLPCPSHATDPGLYLRLCGSIFYEETRSSDLRRTVILRCAFCACSGSRMASGTTRLPRSTRSRPCDRRELSVVDPDTPTPMSRVRATKTDARREVKGETMTGRYSFQRPFCFNCSSILLISADRLTAKTRPDHLAL